MFMCTTADTFWLSRTTSCPRCDRLLALLHRLLALGDDLLAHRPEKRPERERQE